jgi:Lrp/AsnC family transcriptional regulator, regulator for asnA, asnC and gidA
VQVFLDRSNIYGLAVIISWYKNRTVYVLQGFQQRHLCLDIDLPLRVQFNEDLLDEINLKIIDILSRDSSTRFVEIARKIGISDATVHMRVRRLIATRIIRKFTISVNNCRIGYHHLAFMGINVEPGFAEEVVLGLSNVETVLEIHEMHGRFDLILKIRAKDLDEMRDVVVNKIRTLPHILEIELMTVLKSRKEEQTVHLKRDIAEKTEPAIA